MTYRLYYTSADRPGRNAPHSVYSEEYESADAWEPIEGLTVHVATLRSKAEADAAAAGLQEALGGDLP